MSTKSQNESINFMLSQICKAQRTLLNDGLAGLGLYAGQEMFLWQLWQQDGLSQSELVERMCVQPPTISKMLDRMEKAGLVTRRPDPDDSRISQAYLTPQGRRSQKAVGQVWQNVERQLTQGLTADELKILRRLLHQLNENLSQSEQVKV